MTSEKRPQFGNRYLVDETEVFKHNAWDDVEWDEEQTQRALEVVERNSQTKMSSEDTERLELEASKLWDEFYGVHNNRFFKDRNWLFTEFPELKAADEHGEEEVRLLEVGCGAGNSVFPILDAIRSPKLRVYCCDFSSTAVGLVAGHDLFDSARCVPFQCDISKRIFESETGAVPLPVEEGSLDYVLLIFVLSALDPQRLQCAVENVFRLLKPGGRVFFRDYGRYDMAQLRFKPGKCISDNFYKRGDGTRCYFFAQEEVRELFCSAGFVEEQLKEDKRLQVNRGKQLKMYRIWIQAKFKKPETP